MASTQSATCGITDCTRLAFLLASLRIISVDLGSGSLSLRYIESSRFTEPLAIAFANADASATILDGSAILSTNPSFSASSALIDLLFSIISRDFSKPTNRGRR